MSGSHLAPVKLSFDCPLNRIVSVAVMACYAWMTAFAAESAAVPDRRPTNNLILQVQVQDLARVEVVVTGPGLSAPIKHELNAKNGMVNEGLYVPPGVQRTISVTLIDGKGTVLAKGASRDNVTGKIRAATILIPLLPAKGSETITASLSSTRVVITQQGDRGKGKRAVEFRARLFDANDREIPLKPGMVNWDVYGPAGGGLAFDPTQPGIGYYYPPVGLDKPRLNPCACIVGSQSCRCLSVFTPTPFTQVTAGKWHSCALDSNGVAICWGANDVGQLGLATSTACVIQTTPYPLTGICSVTPVFVSGGHAFTAISAGEIHTCALDTAGKAWCWGDNTAGQLGIGGTTSPAAGGATPQLVSSPTTFSAISAGGKHTCALGDDRLVYCWGGLVGTGANCGETGHSNNSPFPSGTTVPRAVSTTSFKSISAGDQHNCAISATGDVVCWGRGNEGQLGYTGTLPNTSSCSQSSADPKVATVQPNITAVAFVAAGGTTSCAGSATAYDPTLGSITCWGDGTGVPTGSQHYLAMVKRLTLGGTVVSTDHACAVNPPGTAYCWGDNRTGLIGVGGAPGIVSNPTAVVPPPATFFDIEAGPLHTCGIDDKRQVWCWGDNSRGELGDGTQNKNTVPVRVIVPPPLRIRTLPPGGRPKP